MLKENTGGCINEKENKKHNHGGRKPFNDSKSRSHKIKDKLYHIKKNTHMYAENKRKKVTLV